jgi:hypothetical protein
MSAPPAPCTLCIDPLSQQTRSPVALADEVIAITGAGGGIGAGPARNQRQQPH